MAEHTPGPWRYQPDGGSRDGMPGGHIIGSDGHIIASATSHEGEYNQEQLAADLQLSAAAPAMLEALEMAEGKAEHELKHGCYGSTCLQGLDWHDAAQLRREALAQAFGAQLHRA